MGRQFRDMLGEAMWGLVADVGAPLAEAEDITPFPITTTPRRVFRLRFEDGRILKGRRFENTGFVEKNRRIRAALSGSFFPRILAQSDCAMLEEWIEGEVLVAGKVEAELIRECGQQLGKLHHAAIPSMEGTDFAGWDAKTWMRRTRENLQALCSGGVLSMDRARELEGMAESNLPNKGAVGIVLRDLSPENLVRDAGGKLYCIDTGSLSIGMIDEDLCRTWHRWPMGDAERGAFVEGYRKYGEPTGFCTPSIFWAIVVIVNSARFRLNAMPADSAAALRKLDGFLESASK